MPRYCPTYQKETLEIKWSLMLSEITYFHLTTDRSTLEWPAKTSTLCLMHGTDLRKSAALPQKSGTNSGD